jgi:hypothetical protein
LLELKKIGRSRLRGFGKENDLLFWQKEDRAEWVRDEICFPKCCIFMVTWERYDLELEKLVARGLVGGLRVGNATGSFLTSGRAMNEELSSSSASLIQVFVVVVEVVEGWYRPKREETVDERRERVGIAVKWEPFDWEDAVAWLFDWWCEWADGSWDEERWRVE